MELLLEKDGKILLEKMSIIIQTGKNCHWYRR